MSNLFLKHCFSAPAARQNLSFYVLLLSKNWTGSTPLWRTPPLIWLKSGRRGGVFSRYRSADWYLGHILIGVKFQFTRFQFTSFTRLRFEFTSFTRLCEILIYFVHASLEISVYLVHSVYLIHASLQISVYLVHATEIWVHLIHTTLGDFSLPRSRDWDLSLPHSHDFVRFQFTSFTRVLRFQFTSFTRFLRFQFTSFTRVSRFQFTSFMRLSREFKDFSLPHSREFRFSLPRSCDFHVSPKISVYLIHTTLCFGCVAFEDWHAASKVNWSTHIQRLKAKRRRSRSNDWVIILFT